MVTTKLNLSMTEPQVRQIYAKQGDTGRVLDITLDQTPEDGTLRILRPDGVEVTSEAVTGGEVESGSSFDSLTEADVTELTVGIEPVQDLNGYDAPWVGGAGKNKVDNSTIEVGYYTESGQHSLSTDYRTSALTPAKPNTVYSTSIFAKNTKERVGGLVATCWDANESIIGQYTTSPFTTPADTAYVRVRNFQAAISYITSDNFLYQLEEGSSATTYSPYSNICPITGHDEVTVTDEGKNRALFANESNQDRASFTYESETANKIVATSTSTGKFVGRYEAFLVKGVSYKLLYTNKGASTAPYIYRDRLWGSLVRTVYPREVFTVDTTQTYVIGVYAPVNSTYDIEDFMVIEASETDTAWTPYQGSTYTTSLGQTVYGGTLDLVSGVLTVDKGFYTVTDVSEIIGIGSKVGTYPKWLLAINSFPNVDPSYYGQFWDRQDAVICNMGIMVRESVSLNTNETTMSVYFHANSMEIRLRPLESDFPTLEEAKQAYVGAEFVYPVIPTTYQLTAQQIKTLVGTNNVWASSGDIISIKFTYGGLLSEPPSEATEIVGKCYCDIEQNGVSSMPFTLNVKKNERES